MLVDEALALAARGWPVFPLGPRGKRPLIPKDEGGNGCLDATTDATVIRTWWARCPAANVGLATGPGSGIFVLDVDPRHNGDATLAALEAQHGALPSTLRATTGGGGSHYFFRLPPGVEIRNGVGAHRLGEGLDVRGVGGYVVAAPSVTDERVTGTPGGRYAWATEDTPADPPAWLLDLARAPARPPPPPLPTPSGARPVDAMTRASAYLAKLPPALSGSGGHQATWAAALALVRGFDLDTGSALYLLEREYNPRCEPPWTRRELEHKVTSAERANLPRGYLLDDPRRQWTAPPWRSRPERIGETPDPPPVEGPTPQEPLRGLPLLARVALVGRDRILARAREPVAYVWQDIAPAGTIVVMAGGPSEGKTTLLFLLLAARANLGEPVSLLGRDVKPAPMDQWVVLIEGEHGEHSTSRKMVKSCALMGVNDLALTRVIAIARKAVKLGSPEWSEVEKMIAAGIVSDIAIDTVARVAPSDANNEQEQVAIFDTVAQAIERAPESKAPTAWAVAHTRKSGSGDLADVSGSFQRVGQADSVLLVKGKKKDGRTVSSTVTFAKLREDPEDYPQPVTWAIVPAPDGGRALVLDGEKPLDDRPLEARIEEQLAGGPKTKNALASALGRSKSDLEEPISNLFSARRIRTVDVQVSGRPRKGFALRQDAPAWAGSSMPQSGQYEPRD